jgi:tetratricopeptide (TPR) repeat protein
MGPLEMEAHHCHFDLSMNKKCLITLLFLLLGVPALFAESPLDALTQKREETIRELIKANPKSETNLYHYAAFLHEQQRVAEALDQLKKLLEIHPQHAKGIRLKKHLEDLEQTKDPKERQAKIQAFEEQQLQMLLDNLKDISEGLKGLTPSPADLEKEQRLRILDERYGISKYPHVHQASPADPSKFQEFMQRTVNLSKLQIENPAEAERMLREDTAKDPSREDFWNDLLKLLFRQKKFDELQIQLTQALKKFPKNPDFLILRDGLKEVRAIKSVDAQNEGYMKVVFQLSDADTIRMNRLFQTNKEPEKVQIKVPEKP